MRVKRFKPSPLAGEADGWTGAYLVIIERKQSVTYCLQVQPGRGGRGLTGQGPEEMDRRFYFMPHNCLVPTECDPISSGASRVGVARRISP